jgi:ribonuclease HIII
MDKASAASGMKLPLGASAAVVEAGQALVARDGAESLAKLAKLHFRTTHAVLGTAPPDGD